MSSKSLHIGLLFLVSIPLRADNMFVSASGFVTSFGAPLPSSYPIHVGDPVSEFFQINTDILQVSTTPDTLTGSGSGPGFQGKIDVTDGHVTWGLPIYSNNGGTIFLGAVYSDADAFSIDAMGPFSQNGAFYTDSGDLDFRDGNKFLSSPNSLVQNFTQSNAGCTAIYCPHGDYFYVNSQGTIEGPINFSITNIEVTTGVGSTLTPEPNLVVMLALCLLALPLLQKLTASKRSGLAALGSSLPGENSKSN